MWLKFCGVTQPDQIQPLVECLRTVRGMSAIGLIGVPQSPRYLPLPQFVQLAEQIPAGIERVGVFMDQTVADLQPWAACLTAIQLHGSETPADCAAIRAAFPQHRIIKAFRLKARTDLDQLATYSPHVDTCLLDAFHPDQGGGMGQRFDWRWLHDYNLPPQWILAGGLRPDNVATATQSLHPWGLDVSSGIEAAPGIKDLAKARAFVAAMS